jgi:golgin subfamily A protein 1
MKKTLQKELKYQALPNEQLKLKSVDSQYQFSPIKSNISENLNNNFTSMPSTPTTSNSNNFSALNKHELINGSKMSSINPPIISRKQSASAQTSSINQTRKFSITNGTVNNTISLNSMDHLEDDINFKYLKHVVLKFLTSKEYEVKK